MTSLFADLETAQVVSPDNGSVTRFAPYVTIRPETRDAAVALVNAVWDWIETMAADGEADDSEMVKLATRFFS